jgi:ubiquinone biosynthesis protein UbiJ
MDRTLGAPPEPKTPAEYRGAIDALIAEMWRMHGRMDQNRCEIERLEEETDAIKEDTERIKARLQSRLDDLTARL